MAPLSNTNGDRAIAPLFRGRQIRTINVTLPVELVLEIFRLAAASDPRSSRAFALVCRAVYLVMDLYQFRVLRWRDRRHSVSLERVFLRRGSHFLADHLQYLYWDWSRSRCTASQLDDVRSCLGYLRQSPRRFRLSTLALNIAVVGSFVDLLEETALKDLMVVFGPSLPGHDDYLRLPYRHLTHLLLRNCDWWPEEEIFGCQALTHLALDKFHVQDEIFAQEHADRLQDLTADVLRRLPLLQCFLFILVDDGEVPQFSNAYIYAEALRDAKDDRVRIDFDTIPCDWHQRWWRSRTREGGAPNGMDFWDSGCAVPQNLRLAKPPLSHFLSLPSD